MKFFTNKPKDGRRQNPNRSHIPFRLNFLFLIVFLLFAALIGQLAYLQILHGAMFENEVTSATTETETQNVQRGQIYDATGRVLVSNKSSRAIVYTKPTHVTSEQLYAIATDLTKYITVDTDDLSESYKVDYYLVKHEKQVNKHIPRAASLKASDLYRAQSKYIREANLVDDLSPKQREVALLYGKMNGAYSLSSVYLKTSGVTSKEMALVGEHQSEMAGISVGTSWKRNYPNGKAVQSVIGTVTSEKSGLPDNSLNQLLAQGYARNDSVGSTYIESKYENVLKGTKKTIMAETRNGELLKKTTQYGGKKGDDIVLTINSKFQKEVQDIVETQVKNNLGGNPYMNGGYAVVMNPYNGNILALAGATHNIKKGTVTEDALGTINKSFVMGSVVKGAMVMGGLTSGVITPNNSSLVDSPIKIAGTPAKSSWFNKSGSATMPLTASQALAVSSNVYMMKLAMLEAGFDYQPGTALTMSPKIFQKLRQNFKQFGLGIKTGIDIPGETSGYEGPGGKANIGKALDMSFGNYDAYTTIQLAQYVAMIANGGYRIQPHILQAIRESSKSGKLGRTVYQHGTNVLGSYTASKDEWDVVKSGLYQVVHSSLTYRTGGALADIKPEVSAKTGTAQTFYGQNETTTLSAISYAPSENPQVVVVVAYPGISAESSGINTTTVKQIYEAYWKDVQDTKNLD
ncbi:peptidoglycan D,D-transpeptidase FtsI family protein [Ligilactobacillus equi]